MSNKNPRLLSKYKLSSELPQRQAENCSIGHFCNLAYRCKNKEKEKKWEKFEDEFRHENKEKEKEKQPEDKLIFKITDHTYDRLPWQRRPTDTIKRLLESL